MGVQTHTWSMVAIRMVPVLAHVHVCALLRQSRQVNQSLENPNLESPNLENPNLKGERQLKIL